MSLPTVRDPRGRPYIELQGVETGTVDTDTGGATTPPSATGYATQAALDAVESASIDADAALDARVDALELDTLPTPTVGALLRGEDDGAGGAVWTKYDPGVEGQVLVMLGGLPTWGTLSGGISARSLLRSPDGSPLLSPDGSSLITTS